MPRPGNTEEVAAAVHACHAHKIAVVPQGGNTSLCGATPATGDSVVISLQRLNRVRQVDPLNNTVTVEAGVARCNICRTWRDEHGRLFPVKPRRRGKLHQSAATCRPTRAARQCRRYGNTRELCLGLEVVTPKGEIWHGLRGLRKDNTGYDLRDSGTIGAEGTLGIITAAVMKLFRYRALPSRHWRPPQARARLSRKAGHRPVPCRRDADRLRSSDVGEAEHGARHRRTLPQLR
ncbi:FAD-binding oxidoreductase [Cupriavidus basilensis]